MKMKIALTGVFTDMYDEPLYRDEKKNKLTMKDVIMSSLLTPETPTQGKETDSEEKFKKYSLYAKIKPCLTNVVVTVEELTSIKKFIGDTKAELIMGQAWDILEKAEQVKETKK